ncbi:MAG: hypothetical protein J5379_03860 [Clostridiales bacterium]|nr:hypothetical protein [Clostridiales bacterium]
MKSLHKITVFALALLMTVSGFCACSKSTGSGNGSTSAWGGESLLSDAGVAGVSNASGSVDGKSGCAYGALVNHMTENERASAEEVPFMLLDHPWEDLSGGGNGSSKKYSDGVYLEVMHNDDWIKFYEEFEDELEEEDRVFLEELRTGDTDYSTINGGCINGRFYSGPLLPEYGYDGGKGMVSVYREGTYVSVEYDGLEDLREKLPGLIEEEVKNKGDHMPVSYSVSDNTDQMVDDIVAIHRAVAEGNYKELPDGAMDEAIRVYYEKKYGDDEDLSWELDEENVAAIADQVHEYHMHDDELDRDFVIHVAVPKGYESACLLASDGENADGSASAKTGMPAIVLTDAVWRFNDISKLLAEMEAGRAAPQILISIGQDYRICNSDNMERAAVFCTGKDKFLDFITDNLMPYLGEIYAIDYENSTLFGHSLGGVFTHYALFNSDRYENQPFGYYIVGSPAFWSPYSHEMSDYSMQADDYGYFERNTSMNKHVLITAGSQEDEDYQEYFEDGDSTTASVVHLQERINVHGDLSDPPATARLYESHHYQYIPEMLVEYASSFGAE